MDLLHIPGHVLYFNYCSAVYIHALYWGAPNLGAHIYPLRPGESLGLLGPLRGPLLTGQLICLELRPHGQYTCPRLSHACRRCAAGPTDEALPMGMFSP